MVLALSNNKKSRFIHQNQQDYSDIYPSLNFVQHRQVAEAERQRHDLMTKLTQGGGFSSCHGTKPHLGPLSPGCRLCVEGSWSCLFVNGRCNLSCFYCPSSQDDIGEPTTNNLSFVSADHYLSYLKHFGFRGFSLSPTQTHDYFAALATITSAGNRCDPLSLPDEIRPFEQIERGLASYF